MTTDEVRNAVTRIAAEVLEVAVFDDSISMDTTASWDSVRHVELLTAIERELDIVIDDHEAFKLVSADRLLSYLTQKVSAKG